MKIGWQTKRLGEVAVVSAGNSAPQDESLFKDGTYPFFRTADAGRVRFGDIYTSADYLNKEGIRGLRRYPKGTILFPKSGASTFLNHRVMLGVEGCVSSHLATIVANETQIEPRFLLYFLSTIAAQNLVQDHTYPSLNLPTIAGISIKVPQLTEQQRIVGILDEAFEGIATATVNAEKNLQNVRALFESHLQSVFTQRGKGWAEKTLGDVCKLFQGLAINKNTKHLLVSKSSLPLLRIKDLRDNTEEQYVSEDGYPKNALVREDDILYTRTGNSLGLVFTGRRGVLHNNSFKISPDPSLRKDYLFWWLQTAAFKRKIFLLASKAAQPDIPHSIFKEQPISVPPLKEQEAIARRVISLSLEVNNLESIYGRKLATLDALKKSLLHQAFIGEL